MPQKNPIDVAQRLADQIESIFPVGTWRRAVVAVGVSGGPDSVALLRLLHSMADQSNSDARIVVLHCNHNTRDCCAEDEAFVGRLAASLGLEFCGVQREANGAASEETLRNFRYTALLSNAKTAGARYLVTGHHADDQIETVLFRVFRGTALAGLGGIPRQRVEDDVTIVRPLLNVRRAEILEYLNQIEQRYCRDESNQNTTYARNFIRCELLPLIESKFPQVSNAIVRLSQQALQHEALLDQLASDVIANIELNPRSIDIRIFENQPDVLVIHVLKKVWRRKRYPEQAMSQEKWEHLLRLAKSSSPQVAQFPGNITVERVGHQLSFKFQP